MNTLKAKGYHAEELVSNYYKNKGYTLLEKNWTIPGGEIDIIMQKEDEIIFIEVKVVDGIEDLDSYLTPKKIEILERSIETYCTKLKWEYEIRLDVVFVQKEKIIEIFENISNL